MFEKFASAGRYGPILSVAVDIAVDGIYAAIPAPPAGVRLLVLQACLIMPVVGSFSIKTGSTIMFPFTGVVAGQGFAWAASDVPWIRGTVAQALNIDVAGGGKVQGIILYCWEYPSYVTVS